MFSPAEIRLLVWRLLYVGAYSPYRNRRRITAKLQTPSQNQSHFFTILEKRMYSLISAHNWAANDPLTPTHVIVIVWKALRQQYKQDSITAIATTSEERNIVTLEIKSGPTTERMTQQ